MRLSNVLFQLNYKRYVDRLWKKEGAMIVPDLIIPPALKEKNVKIINSKDILLETRMFKPEEKPPASIRCVPRSVFMKEENIFYQMNEKVKVSENENQAFALTKTVPYKGLPTNLNSLIGVENLPNQDEIMKNTILQSLTLDSIQDKLPKKVDVKRPGWKFAREFGIRKKRKVSSLLEKMTIYCDSVSGKYEESLQRKKFLAAYSEVSITKGSDTVVFQMPSDILLTSPKPLQRFSSSDLVSETRNQEVPNIYPIKPTLDLIKCDTNPAKWGEVDWNPINSHLHTLFIGQKSIGFWFPKQMLARAIATCFSFAAVEAQRKYGNDVKVLPEPISIQCVYMDIQYFNFLAYQLNTLDVHHNDGIKNQVWIDEPSNLYKEISEMNEIVDYNSDVISKMLALYINGLHPLSL